MDVDDLRREFEAYQRELGTADVVLRRGGEGEVRLPFAGEEGDVRIVDVAPGVLEEVDREPGEVERPEDASPEAEGTVVFEPGMTMEEMEREAIAAALREVSGNRRKAAEMLGIGERTLYRKIKRFGLEEEG
jgi:DNA-binding NtrC family response regulator